MEHWRMRSPVGEVSPYASVEHLDRFVRQLRCLGIEGLELFDTSLDVVKAMFGSVSRYNAFLEQRGMRLVGVFHAPTTQIYNPRVTAPHLRETHDVLFRRCQQTLANVADIPIANFVVMPSIAYPFVHPVTDDKIKVMAELWNRVGQMTARYGVRTACHHEFWCAIRSLETIEKFYEWTDPGYVWYFCDTAQHAIAGVDPVALYRRYHERCAGFHIKDTHNIDEHQEYAHWPDPERMASVKRWFWEIGTPGGLVDAPALWHALREHQYRGWISLELDGAHYDGGTYSESTCMAKWYVDNMLRPIYA
jgi:sugar phosphate isomerase/epimerase